MNIRTLVVVSVLSLPGVLSASSFICTNGITTVSCLNPGDFTFLDSLDWTSAGSAYEANTAPVGTTPYTNPALATSWTGTSLDDNELTATVPGGAMAYIARADEAPWVYAGPALGWIQPGTHGVPVLLTNQGHFNFSTTPPPPAGYANSSTHDWGTALIETWSNQGPLTLTFAQNVSDFGVDISSLNAANFTATLLAYDSNHDLLGTYTLDTNGTNVGGVCTGLNSPPGTACNDAPFIAIGGTNWQIKYVVLSVVSDPTGRVASSPVNFAIDGPLFSEGPSVPEPGAVWLSACGLAAIWWRRRRRTS